MKNYLIAIGAAKYNMGSQMLLRGITQIIKENGNEKEEKEKRLLQNLDRYLVHPLVHSIKIFFCQKTYIKMGCL